MDISDKITRQRGITLVPIFMILLIEILQHCSCMNYVYLGSRFLYMSKIIKKYYFRVEILLKLNSSPPKNIDLDSLNNNDIFMMILAQDMTKCEIGGHLGRHLGDFEHVLEDSFLNIFWNFQHVNNMFRYQTAYSWPGLFSLFFTKNRQVRQF